ncbi:Exodeoxyribonuclease 7 large subunit [Nitrospira japonica]|uniref:Exodeoxyribonuclease 7 large subunit n=2 Tax=Nitrospira japonica TaxID=1325564 RepID=A0A1W1I0Y8_9BACT|nr:Exodeoxyribonuclease 7 large subunit [Nitrospira japonica]
MEGEISNLRTPASGHVYCTLKDERSQIRAVLFRSSAVRIRFALQDGMHVIVRGRLSVYEPRGEYQILMEAVEPKGVGALQVAFDQLRTRLSAEGLFDALRKKQIPRFPRTVGVVTSLNGAALKDILSVLGRRWPTLHVIVVPVQVQGEPAAQQIIEALTLLNAQRSVEVIILGRGGGSLEDLWTFNEEAVVRAVAASRIPIVSAVGHEIDMTLTDAAADLRAPTPSVAAEMVVPVLSEVLEGLRGLTVRLQMAMARHCLSEHRRLDFNSKGLSCIQFRLREKAQQVDDMTDCLIEKVRSRAGVEGDRVRQADRELSKLSPFVIVKRHLVMIPLLFKRLQRQTSVMAAQRRRRIEATCARLNSLSPLAVLGRGYGLLTKISDGSVLKRAQDARVGEAVAVRLMDGKLHCLVKDVLPDRTV